MIAVRVSPPIVAVNVAIGPCPKDAKHELPTYRRLLELNATDLMHASYGIENGTIVLSAALALDNLDANELEATLSDIDVALVRHQRALRIARGLSGQRPKGSTPKGSRPLVRGPSTRHPYPALAYDRDHDGNLLASPPSSKATSMT
ncbi:MAG: hypothetical protein IPG04_14765 [Polyangiaceae bacterium]|nr:hypothetical protein [Polyangiaceae bacterium]